MPHTYELSLRPVTERRCPTFERLLDRTRALTAASANWEAGKTVGGVRTFSLKPLEGKGPRWWARVSEHEPRHGKSSFDLLYAMFTKDRFQNEREFNKNLESAQYLKNCQWGEVWSLHYVFPAPISPRSSTILTVTHLETVTPRIFWVISIPFKVDADDIALSLFVEAGVPAQVCSVERFRELDGGRCEWLCASTMSPGGSIPLWLSEHFALKRTTSIVPKVDQFLEKPPKARSTRGSASKTAPAADQNSAETTASVSTAPASNAPVTAPIAAVAAEDDPPASVGKEDAMVPETPSTGAVDDA
ncbi:hypothetical protein DL93DRAFT_58596 [Clavulina sp. PMI_390]|nr:hypothetical protein DL93DRAFT_58596 [Clavulina sp. PMI_390]